MKRKNGQGKDGGLTIADGGRLEEHDIAMETLIQ